MSSWGSWGLRTASDEAVQRYEPWSEYHKSTTTPFIARGTTVGFPEDDHDLFHAIHERRATPDQLHRLVGHNYGNAGVWWGTYGGESGEHDPEGSAYGNLVDFKGHTDAGLNDDLSVDRYIEGGYYDPNDRIICQVPVVMVGQRPKRGTEPWDPEVHNPPENLMGNSYLDDDEEVPLTEIHYHTGTDWVKVRMPQGITVKAYRTAAAAADHPTDGVRYAHVVEADVAADLARLAARGGDCYQASGRYILDNPTANVHLVHGDVDGRGAIAGTRMGHAWIEDGDQVIDRSNGGDVRLPKHVYYAMGNIGGTVRYTPDQAMAMMAEHEHFGPWHDTTTAHGGSEPEGFHVIDEGTPWDDPDDEPWDEENGWIGSGPPDDDHHTAARLAMPWPDWAPKVQGGCQGCDGTGDYGEYYIDHPDGSGKQPGDIMPGLNGRSVLHFYHDTGRDGQPELYVSGLHTDSKHRQDGVAESLMRHLHRSHPGTRINPGFMTEDGQAFHDRMLDKEPEAKGTLTPRFAMPKPMPEGVTFHYHPTQDTIPTETVDWHDQPVPVFSAPAVEARHRGETVGHLGWDTGLPAWLGGEDDPVIDMVKVHPDYQRHGIGTALFDFARQHEPGLRHSDTRTERGDQWVEYEQSRSGQQPVKTATDSEK